MNTNTQKTALVTGASRGMGRATALVLGRANIRVFVHYGRSVADANIRARENPITDWKIIVSSIRD